MPFLPYEFLVAALEDWWLCNRQCWNGVVAQALVQIASSSFAHASSSFAHAMTAPRYEYLLVDPRHQTSQWSLRVSSNVPITHRDPPRTFLALHVRSVVHLKSEAEWASLLQALILDKGDDSVGQCYILEQYVGPEKSRVLAP
jgi:hypothetical protein